MLSFKLLVQDKFIASLDSHPIMWTHDANEYWSIMWTTLWSYDANDTESSLLQGRANKLLQYELEKFLAKSEFELDM
jgi:hypothetical protein